MAAVAGLRFQRIQFTSDLLPSDIVGVSIFDRDAQRFRFHPGPVFAELVLADEINRGSPRTQSALLEAMAERQVTVDGERHPLPRPFLVIATQNPVDLAGTFPLPDSQLDRFLLCVGLGYPDRAAERRMLEEPDRRRLLESLEPALSPRRLLELAEQARTLRASGALLDYLQDLLAASRDHPAIAVGLSP
ncbi:MAG: AAA family ATPase, partial [Myxococcales bacterium]|nr:AAA family ATPase [Myxococcales bacterium]